MPPSKPATLNPMTSEKTKEILFVPYKLHLRYFLFPLAQRVPVATLVPPEKTLPEDCSLHGVPIRYFQFGAQFIKPIIGSVRTLKYIPGFVSLLKTLTLHTLITFEYYHWYTFQCLAYKKKHPEVPFFIVWETKRWPRNVVACFFKYLALTYIQRNKHHINGIFVYTDTAKAFAEKYMPNVPVRLLPAPTDTALFVPHPNKAFCVGGVLRLVMNARYSDYKRHEDVFAAIKKLQAQGKTVHLTCISREQQGKEAMMKKAQAMGVDKSVTFIDPLPHEEIPALYTAHDILILPSYNEAIGMVVPEAMACGIPTITSDTVGGNVYVAKNETGFIYETGNVDALVETLGKCFDATTLKTMGAAARSRIIEHFTPEAVVDQFLKDISYH